MTLRTFEALRSFIPLLFSFVICVCLPVVKAKSDSMRWEKYMLLIQVSLRYILKHLDDRKAWNVHIYYTWCDIILIFKLHRRTRLMPRSSIYSLKIRMTSHPCNKFIWTYHDFLSSKCYVEHALLSSDTLLERWKAPTTTEPWNRTPASNFRNQESDHWDRIVWTGL